MYIAQNHMVVHAHPIQKALLATTYPWASESDKFTTIGYEAQRRVQALHSLRQNPHCYPGKAIPAHYNSHRNVHLYNHQT